MDNICDKKFEEITKYFVGCCGGYEEVYEYTSWGRHAGYWKYKKNNGLETYKISWEWGSGGDYEWRFNTPEKVEEFSYMI